MVLFLKCAHGHTAGSRRLQVWNLSFPVQGWGLPWSRSSAFAKRIIPRDRKDGPRERVGVVL